MGKKDITPLLMHWSSAFLALTHLYVTYKSAGVNTVHIKYNEEFMAVY